MKTIKLSENSINKYFLTSIKKEHFDLIKKGDVQKIESHLDIKVNNILKIGEKATVKIVNLEEYLEIMRGRNLGEGREIHYRNYLISKEKQKESIHLINQCPDKKMSVNSLLQVMPETHLVLWREKK